MAGALHRAVTVAAAIRVEALGLTVRARLRAVALAVSERLELASTALHCDAAVRWVETIQKMAVNGVDTVVEIGPGKVLSGLVRRIDKGLRAYPVEDPASLSTVLREVFK